MLPPSPSARLRVRIGEEWTYFVQNLDVYAESGAYYYWVEEVNVQPGGVTPMTLAINSTTQMTAQPLSSTPHSRVLQQQLSGIQKRKTNPTNCHQQAESAQDGIPLPVCWCWAAAAADSQQPTLSDVFVEENVQNKQKYWFDVEQNVKMFQNFLTTRTLYVTIQSRSSEQTENRRRQMANGHRHKSK